MSLFDELKRRNVIRMAGLYLVGAWLVVQVSGTLLPMFDAPNWLPRGIVILLAIGFIPSLVFSWAFELTPSGLKRDEEVTPAESIAPQTARRMNRLIIAVLVLALAYFCFDKIVLTPRREAALVAATEKSFAARPSAETNAKSIAVLPFENLSDDKQNAYFAEGVQDEILTRLAKVADLKVIARTSMQRFKSTPENLPEIAKQLGVLNILEGSVQKVNDQVRVNVQLINALTNAHLWAEIYDRKLTDIFSVESDIAKTIADTLQAKLTGSEMRAMANAPTEDPVAHELYLKGRHFWGLRGDNLPRALEFYNQAITRDPNYAQAYAGLSETYVLLPYYTGADPKDVRPKARAAALKALELNPNLAEAHNAIGKVAYNYDIDIQKSLREHQRAIELSPNYAGAHHWLTGPLKALKRLDEAIAESRRSTELDPLSAVNMVDLAQAYLFARRFKDADATLKKALEIDPGFAYAHWTYGIMLQVSGDLEGARAQYATARVRENDPQAIAMRGQLGAIMGRREEAVTALATLKELGKQRYVEAYYRALLYLSLGQKDEALSSLEQSYAERDGDNIAFIKVDPLLDSLHGDPRFEALAQKVVGPKAESSP